MKDLSNKFKPNSGQKSLVKSIWENDITVVSVPAGSGKSLMTLQTFLQLLCHKHIERIIAVRLISDTCDEHLGALPGDKSEKLLPFLAPVLDNLRQILNPGELDYLINKEKIEVLPVSYVRGRTFARCGILVDECQNLSNDMVLTVATRIGEGSRMVFAGDPDQVDIRGRNGISYAHRLLEEISGVGCVRLTTQDIERHPLIAEIIERSKQLL